MVDHNDQMTPDTHSRPDGPGRLFRPHWNLFRIARQSSSAAAARDRRAAIDGFDPKRHPLDVICGGMYRACSTWQYEVVAHLIERHVEGERLGYLTANEYATLVRSDQSQPIEASRQTARWRVVKSHDKDPAFARAVAQERALAVYAYRDVREVVFSLMHKRGMTFERLVRQGMIHQVLANDRFWIAQPDVLVQRYEDLLAEPARGVAELARHLGIRLDEGEAGRIADEYSHESNRVRTDALRRRLEEAGVNLESGSNAQICDPKTLLHWNHIRQGDAKSWQALANPRQRLVLARLCGRWLRARGYPPDTTLTGLTGISVRDLARVEIDLLVARANFAVRATSQRFPRAARTVKRLLGLPVDANAGATAWADALPPQPRPNQIGRPHISLSAQPNRHNHDVAQRS